MGLEEEVNNPLNKTFFQKFRRKYGRYICLGLLGHCLGILGCDYFGQEQNSGHSAANVDDIKNKIDGYVACEQYFFRDNDGDGFGDVSVYICELISGYVENNLDCDDSNPKINPNAKETNNNVDDNCNGEIDEGLKKPNYSHPEEAYNDKIEMPGNGFHNCPIQDMDIENELVIILCGYPVGKIAEFKVNEETDWIGEGDIVLTSGVHPAFKECKTCCDEDGNEENVECVSIVEKHNPDGTTQNIYPKKREYVPEVKWDIIFADTIDYPVQSALCISCNDYYLDNENYVFASSFNNEIFEFLWASNNFLFLLTSEFNSNNGLINPSPIEPIPTFSKMPPIYTSGKMPTAATKLYGSKVAVLNRIGEDEATIDIIVTEEKKGDEKNSENWWTIPPEIIIEKTIKLGINNIPELDEFPATFDHLYAVVPASGKAVVVDLMNYSVVSEVSLEAPLEKSNTPTQLTPTDIFVKINEAYISTKEGVIAVVNINEPTQPTVNFIYNVGHDLGPIVVHSCGVIYVAATAKWKEEWSNDKNMVGEYDPKKWNNLIALYPPNIK